MMNPRRVLPGLFGLLLSLAALASAHSQEIPGLSETDRIALRGFQRLAATTAGLWPGWSKTSIALLLSSREREYLLFSQSRPDGFLDMGDDSVLGTRVYGRAAQFPPNLLATFPAFGLEPIIVVGTPEKTGKSPTEWSVLLLHEHFHQYQMSWPEYAARTAALGKELGAQTSSWMLEYPFPYDSARISERIKSLGTILADLLESGSSDGKAVANYVNARAVLASELGAKHYAYFAFQTWQEGVARYTQYRTAHIAAEHFQPAREFAALTGYLPFAQLDSLYARKLSAELRALDLPAQRRTAFYAIGNGEAVLLDRIKPDWRSAYFNSAFDLGRLLAK